MAVASFGVLEPQELRFTWDYTAFPVWTRRGMVRADGLPISDGLATKATDSVVLRAPVALWGENFKTAAMFNVVAGQTVVREDDPRSGTLEHPVALVPLRLRDAVVGLLVVFPTLEQKHAFIQADHELLKLLSSQAMTALVAARFLADQGASSPLFASLQTLGIT